MIRKFLLINLKKINYYVCRISIPVAQNSSSSKEEEFCCICMERKPNLILPCTHNYCESCIKEWFVVVFFFVKNFIITGKDDEFVLADKPDYYNLQEEMSKSLFEITECKNKKKNVRNVSSIERNSDDSD